MKYLINDVINAAYPPMAKPVYVRNFTYKKKSVRVENKLELQHTSSFLCFQQFSKITYWRFRKLMCPKYKNNKRVSALCPFSYFLVCFHSVAIELFILSTSSPSILKCNCPRIVGGSYRCSLGSCSIYSCPLGTDSCSSYSCPLGTDSCSIYSCADGSAICLAIHVARACTHVRHLLHVLWLILTLLIRRAQYLTSLTLVFGDKKRLHVSKHLGMASLFLIIEKNHSRFLLLISTGCLSRKHTHTHAVRTYEHIQACYFIYIEMAVMKYMLFIFIFQNFPTQVSELYVWMQSLCAFDEWNWTFPCKYCKRYGFKFQNVDTLFVRSSLTHSLSPSWPPSAIIYLGSSCDRFCNYNPSFWEPRLNTPPTCKSTCNDETVKHRSAHDRTWTKPMTQVWGCRPVSERD